MKKYYCNCLNICIELDESSSEPYEKLDPNEGKSEFFDQLPLQAAREVSISKQLPMLLKLEKVGPWVICKCINCSLYSHAVESNSGITLINVSLNELDEEQLRVAKDSFEYSPLFNVIVSDASLFDTFMEPSHIRDTKSNECVLELQRKLSDYIDQKSKITEETVRAFVEQQQTLLKKYIKRATDDFQIIKTIMLKNDVRLSMDSQDELEINSKVQINSDQVSVDIPDAVIMNAKEETSINYEEKAGSQNNLTMNIPPSLDSEGLFPLDGMEENAILDEDGHSEDDQSDTDDSGSRDEGIYIPRRRSMAIAKSLPIRVPMDFDPSLRWYHGKAEESKSKRPNYKQKRNEGHFDIAASIKALANSVHGDTIFGDLPPPRIGSRI